MNKIRTARLLMAATMIVIIAFQVYWIRKLYAEEQENFKKTTDIIFREAMFKLQAERFAGDIKMLTIESSNPVMTDVVSRLKDININSDSSKRPGLIVRMNTSAQFSTTENEDSSNHKDKDTMVYVDTRNSNKRSINIGDHTLNPAIYDTIPIKRIDSLYSALLQKEGINVRYKIAYVTPPVKKDSSGKRMVINITQTASIGYATKQVPVGFMSPFFYKAEFETPTIYLLKKISLPVLLSVLMVALATLSFIFIYRNLIAQRRLTAIKNEFIGNITHELKTPIATVSVAIEAMKNFNALQNPERTQEYLGIAGQELNRLSLLVDKVLRLSMFETQQVELKYEWFDIKDLVKEVLNSMQLQFEKIGAEVKLELHGEDFTVMADQMHVTSVVYNLLDNALKYSKGKPQIAVDVEGKDEQIVLKVKDNGIGIAASYKDKVFDKFFRVPNGDKHNVKGYGLGLSYVAHIIARHKGTVEVESEEGQSTTFIIKLPKENAGS